MPTEPNKYIVRQIEYCYRKQVPVFIPTNGVCFKCGREIYMHTGFRRYAHKEHIVSCPYCAWSYCD